MQKQKMQKNPKPRGMQWYVQIQKQEFILCALFSIGYHVGKDRSVDFKENALITVKLEKIKRTPEENDMVLIDGKYECRLVSIENGELSLLCEGYFNEAGFLFSGCKYISKNQPLKALEEWGYFEGRVSEIEKV